VYTIVKKKIILHNYVHGLYFLLLLYSGQQQQHKKQLIELKRGENYK